MKFENFKDIQISLKSNLKLIICCQDIICSVFLNYSYKLAQLRIKINECFVTLKQTHLHTNNKKQYFLEHLKGFLFELHQLLPV